MVETERNLAAAAAARAIGDWAAAEQAYRSALAQDRRLTRGWTGLAFTLQMQQRLPEALEAIRRAAKLAPNDPVVLNLQANQNYLSHRYVKAAALYRRLAAHEPRERRHRLNLAACLQFAGDVDGALATLDAAAADGLSDAAVMTNMLYIANYQTDVTADEIAARFKREAGRLYMAAPTTVRASTEPNLQRKLKIGYVSGDFRRHASMRFILPILEHHDRTRFVTYAYSTSLRADDVTQRVRNATDDFIDASCLDDDALAARVRADAIDVLVDLSGHSAGNRLGMFRLGPAPVTVSLISGFGASTGLEWIDYLYADDALAPPGSDHLFVEKVWRTPAPAFAYRPEDGMGEPGDAPFARTGAVTFTSLSRAVRINAQVIAAWAEILKRTPKSRLILNSQSFSDPDVQIAYAARFRDAGIDPGRITLGFDTPPWDILRATDIVLDCFPHNSGTTLYESLFMGAPFVTLADRPSVGRIGASLLQAVGLGDLVAHDIPAYVAKAVDLAADSPRLVDLRASLRHRMRQSALMDEARSARALESAYLDMFAGWAGGLQARDQ